MCLIVSEKRLVRHEKPLGLSETYRVPHLFFPPRKPFLKQLITRYTPLWPTCNIGPHAHLLSYGDQSTVMIFNPCPINP